MKVSAVCTGQAAPIPAKSGQTGIFKTAQPGPVMLSPTGLAGDTIIDTKHHGGPDQALLIMGEPDRAWWADHLGRPLDPGFFGENLLIKGLETATLCLGDILHMGDVRVQVTAPRIPCATFAARVGDPQAIKDFYAANRPGAYVRVLSTGSIAPGCPVTVTPYSGERITIVENMQAYLTNFDDIKLLARMRTTPAHHKLLTLAQEKLSS